LPFLFTLYDAKINSVGREEGREGTREGGRVVNPDCFMNMHIPPSLPQVTKTRPIGEEMADVWAMVQRKSVLLPMLFVGVRRGGREGGRGGGSGG